MKDIKIILEKKKTTTVKSILDEIYAEAYKYGRNYEEAVEAMVAILDKYMEYFE